MAGEEQSERAWTIQELLKWAAEDFSRRGIDTPRLDAEILLAFAMGVKRVDLYLRFDQVPDPESLARFREAVKLRREREPVAYIVGVKGFHAIELAAARGVFVPRPETELLVDEAVARLEHAAAPSILDVGSGSGAIGLALASAIPSARVWAVDLDPKAVELTRANAKKLGLHERVQAIHGDLFAPVKDMAFDLVACNPPYVPRPEITRLMPEVRDHEPVLALDGGPDGLDFIRRLMGEAPERVNAGGWLMLEVSEGQAEAVVALAGPAFRHEATRKDLRGVPRIVIFLKK
jgi:release factor glutamine methyltransferase